MSAVIETILLVLITVSVTSGAYVFYSRIQTSAVNASASQANSVMQTVGTKFQIESVSVNKVYVRNLGGSVISDLSIYVNGVAITHTGPATLNPGTVGTYVLSNAELAGFTDPVIIKVVVGPFSKSTSANVH